MSYDVMMLTYDISTKQNFRLRVSLMCTINDFPIYEMLFGWMTQGKLACLICIEDTKAFTLKYGGKNYWFDYHRRFQIWIVLIGTIDMDLERTPQRVRLLLDLPVSKFGIGLGNFQRLQKLENPLDCLVIRQNTIGPNKVYSGNYPIRRITQSIIIQMKCTLRRIYLIILYTL